LIYMVLQQLLQNRAAQEKPAFMRVWRVFGKAIHIVIHRNSG
jgi:hypothetical protein